MQFPLHQLLDRQHVELLVDEFLSSDSVYFSSDDTVHMTAGTLSLLSEWNQKGELLAKTAIFNQYFRFQFRKVQTCTTLKVQSWLRACRARFNVARVRGQVMRIQSCVRRWGDLRSTEFLYWKRLQHLSQFDNAARVIQRSWRRYIEQQTLNWIETQLNAAAIIIQRTFRSFVFRRRLEGHLQRKMELELKEKYSVPWNARSSPETGASVHQSSMGLTKPLESLKCDSELPHNNDSKTAYIAQEDTEESHQHPPLAESYQIHSSNEHIPHNKQRAPSPLAQARSEPANLLGPMYVDRINPKLLNDTITDHIMYYLKQGELAEVHKMIETLIYESERTESASGHTSSHADFFSKITNVETPSRQSNTDPRSSSPLVHALLEEHFDDQVQSFSSRELKPTERQSPTRNMDKKASSKRVPRLSIGSRKKQSASADLHFTNQPAHGLIQTQQVHTRTQSKPSKKKTPRDTPAQQQEVTPFHRSPASKKNRATANVNRSNRNHSAKKSRSRKSTIYARQQIQESRSKEAHVQWQQDLTNMLLTDFGTDFH